MPSRSFAPAGAHSELVDGLPPITAVTQHNDLGAWNVVGQENDFVVLDWENVRQSALPLWDLFYFLGNALVLLDDGAYGPHQLPARMARLFAGEARFSPVLFSWVRRAAEATSVPIDAVGPIATLCWLSHSLSAGEHNVDIATFTPRDPPRMHGLEGMARAWMTHPGLGTDWSLWRG